MAIAIKAENLSKAYQLGEFSTGTISQDIERWWQMMRGKEDPFLKIGETNDRTSKGISNVVWSLQDINFEIKQGEAVGIIGRNGAGKSTLLKLLSRVTSPTTGTVKVKGRIASLLEVGTGFHPELTGRENIYLNGAILGMRKHEITKQLDAIVDFSGVARYIDTPVKRYSSGMHVRLAFAIAAHLQSEILIVDEVLAVGDYDFQKKCIQRMESISRTEGRTILFVSHDMKAVGSLCTSGILLNKGTVSNTGNTSDVIKAYMFDTLHPTFGVIQVDNGSLEFTGVKNQEELNNLSVDNDLFISLSFINKKFSSDSFFVDILLINEKGDIVVHSKTKYVHKAFNIESDRNFSVNYKLIKPNLAPGKYVMTLYMYVEGLSRDVLLWIDDIPIGIVNSNNPYFVSSDKEYLDEIKSVVYPQAIFEIDYD